MEAYRASHQKRNAVALSVVVVSHLFLLWLLGQSSFNVRVRAAPFVLWHKTTTYLPSESRGRIEVQLLPLTYSKPVVSLRVVGSTSRTEQKIQPPTSPLIANQRKVGIAESAIAVQRRSDAVKAAESVGESSVQVSNSTADAPSFAPVGAASTAAPHVRISLLDGPIAVGRQARQPSLAEAVNQQLHPDGPKDKLKQDIEAAILPVCLASNEAGGVLAPIAIAYAALRGRCKLP